MIRLVKALGDGESRDIARILCAIVITVALTARAAPQTFSWETALETEWIIETLDSVGSVGLSSSIALDEYDYPHISYFDWTNHDLKYAKWDGSKWVNETVDSKGDVGWPSSIAMDKQGRPHIAYFDAILNDLKYATWDGSIWKNETVDSAGFVGLYPSLALDGLGHPHISYHDYDKGDLKYVRWDGIQWIIETVDWEGTVGRGTSIEIDSSGYPHIGYYDITNMDLKYAMWNGSAWINVTVDSKYDVGAWPSLALDSNGRPHFSYILMDYYDLRYAMWNGSAWIKEPVDTAGRLGKHSSIAIDSNDIPHISYNDMYNGDLKYASRIADSWVYESVDVVDLVGTYTSLAIDSNDNPHISYLNYTSYDLKYATKEELSGGLPPVANSGGPYLGQEGSAIAFDGTGSSDPEGGTLSYSWDFDSLVDSDGDGNFINDVDATGPTPTHSYYDNNNYTVTLKVTDDSGQSDTSTSKATILNVAPTAEADGPFEGDEPHIVQFTGTFTDPGTLDTHTFQWDFDFDGITFNVDSTEQNPAHQWLDDFNGSVGFKVIDDDGGWDLDVTHVTVNNLPPEATANGPYSSFEGTPIQFTGNHTDPGPLDTHTYEWDFSYDGTTFNPDATGNPYQNTWYDDHTGNIALRVTDDDGGWDLDVTTVTIVNVPPIANAGDGKEGYEVSTFTFNGSFYDPGSGDTHTYEWDFDYDGLSFDTDATGQTTSHTWTDDFDGMIAFRVTDDDGGADIDTAHVLVKNVPPTVTLEVLPVEVDAFLRIAGEKWHDVTIELLEDSVLIFNGTIVRYPGSPNDQMLDMSHLQIDVSKRYTATVRYTPEDDPVNGQPNGATPCWIILRFDDSQELWLHHTFNVQHPDTHVWEVDLTAAILSHGITFEATALDPGADDLSFHWDFGDGTNVTNIYPNPNGTYPVSIVDTVTHTFPGSGTFTITVTVEDDDGGIVQISYTLTI